MRICPITYEKITTDSQYSLRGLKMLSPKLKNLNPLTLTSEELRQECAKRANKMSIQGVQPKLSAILSLKNEAFEIVSTGGRFILKPQHDYYPEVPQNEDLTMRLASLIGIEVPLHGLVYGIDNSLTYFIKRFDRAGQASKISVEDFSQLAGQKRATKYNFSMEKIVDILDEYATFPVVEKVKLFTRTLFNFLVGNEDMHLKNFSLITRGEKIELTPAYDFLNSSILVTSGEELALPLHGKKSNINKKDIIDYFGSDHMGLAKKMIDGELDKINNILPVWRELISISFLTASMKARYCDVLDNRVQRLFN